MPKALATPARTPWALADVSGGFRVPNLQSLGPGERHRDCRVALRAIRRRVRRVSGGMSEQYRKQVHHAWVPRR